MKKLAIFFTFLFSYFCAFGYGTLLFDTNNNAIVLPKAPVLTNGPISLSVSNTMVVSNLQAAALTMNGVTITTLPSGGGGGGSGIATNFPTSLTAGQPVYWSILNNSNVANWNQSFVLQNNTTGAAHTSTNAQTATVATNAPDGNTIASLTNIVMTTNASILTAIYPKINNALTNGQAQTAALNGNVTFGGGSGLKIDSNGLNHDGTVSGSAINDFQAYLNNFGNPSIDTTMGTFDLYIPWGPHSLFMPNGFQFGGSGVGLTNIPASAITGLLNQTNMPSAVITNTMPTLTKLYGGLSVSNGVVVNAPLSSTIPYYIGTNQATGDWLAHYHYISLGADIWEMVDTNVDYLIFDASNGWVYINGHAGWMSTAPTNIMTEGLNVLGGISGNGGGLFGLNAAQFSGGGLLSGNTVLTNLNIAGTSIGTINTNGVRLQGFGLNAPVNVNVYYTYSPTLGWLTNGNGAAILYSTGTGFSTVFTNGVLTGFQLSGRDYGSAAWTINGGITSLTPGVSQWYIGVDGSGIVTTNLTANTAFNLTQNLSYDFFTNGTVRLPNGNLTNFPASTTAGMNEAWAFSQNGSNTNNANRSSVQFNFQPGFYFCSSQVNLDTTNPCTLYVNGGGLEATFLVYTGSSTFTNGYFHFGGPPNPVVFKPFNLQVNNMSFSSINQETNALVYCGQPTTSGDFSYISFDNCDFESWQVLTNLFHGPSISKFFSLNTAMSLQTPGLIGLVINSFEEHEVVLHNIYGAGLAQVGNIFVDHLNASVLKCAYCGVFGTTIAKGTLWTTNFETSLAAPFSFHTAFPGCVDDYHTWNCAVGIEVESGGFFSHLLFEHNNPTWQGIICDTAPQAYFSETRDFGYGTYVGVTALTNTWYFSSPGGTFTGVGYMLTGTNNPNFNFQAHSIIANSAFTGTAEESSQGSNYYAFSGQSGALFGNTFTFFNQQFAQNQIGSGNEYPYIIMTGSTNKIVANGPVNGNYGFSSGWTAAHPGELVITNPGTIYCIVSNDAYTGGEPAPWILEPTNAIDNGPGASGTAYLVSPDSTGNWTDLQGGPWSDASINGGDANAFSAWYLFPYAANYIDQTGFHGDGGSITNLQVTNLVGFLTITNPAVLGTQWVNTNRFTGNLVINYTLTDSSITGSPGLNMTNITSGQYFVATNAFVLSAPATGQAIFKMAPGAKFISGNGSSGSASAAINSSYFTP